MSDLKKKEDAALAEQVGELPVVARMVIEVRSDGSRTVARGVLEDLLSEERVALEVKGTTPLALARSLASAIFRTPSLARSAAKALLPKRKK